MKTGICHFVITGEFITSHSREMVIERRWRDALDFLLSNVMGMSPDIATEILSGTKALVGRSDAEITLADDHDEEYKNNLNYTYSSLVKYNNKWLKPYAYVTNYGERDLYELDPNRTSSTRKESEGKEFFQTRARHYCKNKEADKIIMLKISDDTYPVLFESTEPPPYWYSTNRDPQIAVNFSRLDECGHIQWYGKSEKNPKEIDIEESDVIKGRKKLKAFQEEKFEPVKPDDKLISPCGWILPNGTFYGCRYAQHVYYAEWITETLGIKTENAEKYAEDNGWLKIGQVGLGSEDDKTIFLRKVALTQAQLDTLFDWCKKHKVKYPEWVTEEP